MSRSTCQCNAQHDFSDTLSVILNKQNNNFFYGKYKKINGDNEQPELFYHNYKQTIDKKVNATLKTICKKYIESSELITYKCYGKGNILNKTNIIFILFEYFFIKDGKNYYKNYYLFNDKTRSTAMYEKI